MSTGLVIGATGGIGAACSRRLAGTASSLVLSGRRQEILAELVAELGDGVVAVPADLNTSDGRAAIVAAVSEPIAWVVLAHGMPMRNPLAELEEPEIEAVFATNLVAPTLLLRRLLDLPWEPSAVLIVVGSISAARSLPLRAVYGSSKAGIEHLARSLALGACSPRDPGERGLARRDRDTVPWRQHPGTPRLGRGARAGWPARRCL